jgi:hypothetical protein
MKTIKSNPILFGMLNKIKVLKGSQKISLLILVFLAFQIPTKAKSGEAEKFQKERETLEIRKQLDSHLEFPDFLKKQSVASESVNVLFKVDTSGTIQEVNTTSSNPELNQYIVEQLEGTKLTSIKLNEAAQYKVNIHFKLL